MVMFLYLYLVLNSAVRNIELIYNATFVKIVEI